MSAWVTRECAVSLAEDVDCLHPGCHASARVRFTSTLQQEFGVTRRHTVRCDRHAGEVRGKVLEGVGA